MAENKWATGVKKTYILIESYRDYDHVYNW